MSWVYGTVRRPSIVFPHVEIDMEVVPTVQVRTASFVETVAAVAPTVFGVAELPVQADPLEVKARRGVRFPESLSVSVDPTGPSTSGLSTYEHTQTVPSAIWTVQHNLSRRPNISPILEGGRVVLTEKIHVDENTALIMFDAPVTGAAVCS